MAYKIKEIRESKRLTQEELAEKSGISRQTISAIENGKTKDVKSGTIIAIAEALGTTLDDIFLA